MSWEAVSAITDIVGMIAVVGTLIYLASEIRQNAQALSISALRDTTAQWNQWSEMLATSSDLAEIVERGNVSYSDLSGAEKLRYGAYIQAFFDNAESFRSLVVDHNMNKDLKVLEAIVARRLLIPGFAAWWAENTADYSDDFVSWVGALERP